MKNIHENNINLLILFKASLIVLILFFGSYQKALAETLTIQISVNKTELKPGETLNISAVASDGISEVFLTNGENYEELK